MNRRRFLEIVAVSGLGALAPEAWSQPSLAQACWRGIVMGTEGSITLYSKDERNWRQLHHRCLTEIQRLERIFSLYEADSEISRLNRDGILLNGSLEFFDLLDLSQKVWEMTQGGFNPSIQPLWEMYRSFYDDPEMADRSFSAIEIEPVLKRCDFQNVGWNRKSRKVSFSQVGMQLTFNGIAQGYITDRISDMLRAEGFDHILVQLGETRALGTHGSGRPWRIRLDGGNVISLEDRALATSGGYGTLFRADGVIHHLLNPRDGTSVNRFKSLSVLSSTAALADALSTGLYVTAPDQWPSSDTFEVFTT